MACPGMCIYSIGTVKRNYKKQTVFWIFQPMTAGHRQQASGSVSAVEFQPECFAAATVKAPDRWLHLHRRLPVRWHFIGDPALRAGRLRWKAVLLGRAPDHHAIAEIIGRHFLPYFEAIFLPGGLRDVAPLDHGLAGQVENSTDVGQQVIHGHMTNNWTVPSVLQDTLAETAAQHKSRSVAPALIRAASAMGHGCVSPPRPAA